MVGTLQAVFTRTVRGKTFVHASDISIDFASFVPAQDRPIRSLRRRTWQQQRRTIEETAACGPHEQWDAKDTLQYESQHMGGSIMFRTGLAFYLGSVVAIEGFHPMGSDSN